MTINQDTTRRPKPGDYAILDEPGGRRVICGRRLPGGGYCPYELLLVELVTGPWGRTHRLLRFPHHAWVQRNGVWRQQPGTRERHARLRPARSRTLPCATGAQEEGDPYIRVLPAWILCPDCRSKRRLDVPARRQHARPPQARQPHQRRSLREIPRLLGQAETHGATYPHAGRADRRR